MAPLPTLFWNASQQALDHKLEMHKYLIFMIVTENYDVALANKKSCFTPNAVKDGNKLTVDERTKVRTGALKRGRNKLRHMDYCLVQDLGPRDEDEDDFVEDFNKDIKEKFQKALRKNKKSYYGDLEDSTKAHSASVKEFLPDKNE